MESVFFSQESCKPILRTLVAMGGTPNMERFSVEHLSDLMC